MWTDPKCCWNSANRPRFKNSARTLPIVLQRTSLILTTLDWLTNHAFSDVNNLNSDVKQENSAATAKTSERCRVCNKAYVPCTPPPQKKILGTPAKLQAEAQFFQGRENLDCFTFGCKTFQWIKYTEQKPGSVFLLLPLTVVILRSKFKVCYT